MDESRHSALGFNWVEIPEGEFLMGSKPLVKDTRENSDKDEHPQHEVFVDSFFITSFPITNGQYFSFVQSTGYKTPGHWRNGVPTTDKLNHPVTYVDWYDAQAFAEWCGATLPTEAQWEKAARGGDARSYPWGDVAPSIFHANIGNQLGDTTPVDNFFEGTSPYGVYDLAGNVWEWTTSLYQSYPYIDGDGRENLIQWGARVVRGGHYLSQAHNVRCSARYSLYPTSRDVYIGFRVVVSGKKEKIKAASRGLIFSEIPAGPFTMGNNFDRTSEFISHHGANRAADYDNEFPQHTLYASRFRISKTPITNRQYQLFTQDTRYPVPGHWPHGLVTPDLADHPVVYVDWHDAQTFCEWAGVTLPTEMQWERAARWRDGRIWPWGNNSAHEKLANFGRNPGTTPVGQYPEGATVEGVLDMAGNVWEMVASAYRPYPYNPDDGRENLALEEEFVLRGGSFMSPHPRYLRSSVRSMSCKSRRRDHIGFRVVERG